MATPFGVLPSQAGSSRTRARRGRRRSAGRALPPRAARTARRYAGSAPRSAPGRVRDEELDVEEAVSSPCAGRATPSSASSSSRARGSADGYSKRSNEFVPWYLTESVTPMTVTSPACTKPSSVTSSPVTSSSTRKPRTASSGSPASSAYSSCSSGHRPAGQALPLRRRAAPPGTTCPPPASPTTAGGTAAAPSPRANRGVAWGATTLLDGSRGRLVLARHDRRGLGPGSPRRSASWAASSAERSFVPTTPSAGSSASSSSSARLSTGAASRSGPAKPNLGLSPRARSVKVTSWDRRRGPQPLTQSRLPASCAEPLNSRPDVEERIVVELEDARARTTALLAPFSDES